MSLKSESVRRNRCDEVALAIWTTKGERDCGRHDARTCRPRRVLAARASSRQKCPRVDLPGSGRGDKVPSKDARRGSRRLALRGVH